jgi:hypothetical protein
MKYNVMAKFVNRCLHPTDKTEITVEKMET